MSRESDAIDALILANRVYYEALKSYEHARIYATTAVQDIVARLRSDCGAYVYPMFHGRDAATLVVTITLAVQARYSHAYIGVTRPVVSIADVEACAADALAKFRASRRGGDTEQ